MCKSTGTHLSSYPWGSQCACRKFNRPFVITELTALWPSVQISDHIWEEFGFSLTLNVLTKTNRTLYPLCITDDLVGESFDSVQ